MHDVVNITPKQFVIKKSSKSLSLDHKRVEYRRNELPDNKIISKNPEKSTPKSKFSLKTILTKRKQTTSCKEQGNNCPSCLQADCLLLVILYAILKQMSIGKYMAPTSSRTLIQGKMPVNISRRRSGSHGNSINKNNQDVKTFLKNSDGSDVIYCYMDMGAQSDEKSPAISNKRDLFKVWQPSLIAEFSPWWSLSDSYSATIYKYITHGSIRQSRPNS